MKLRRMGAGIGLVAVAALVLSACGSKADESGTSSTTTTSSSSSAAPSTEDSGSATDTADSSSTETPAETSEATSEPAASFAEGCENGWVDPANLSATRPIARCAPGFPAPQPLAEKKKLIVTSATLKGEYLAHLRLAIDKGEFAKENLDVELTQVPPADSINLLATGDSDVAFGGPDGAFMNAVNAGVEAKWVLGNFFPNEKSQTGLWIRDVDGKPGVISDLSGNVLGTAIGPGSVSMYPVVTAFDAAGVSFDSVEFQITPVADLATAFENGAVLGAWLTDPYWTMFVDKPGYTFAQGQPAAEPLGGTIFGKNLLEGDPAIGTAFIRALIRTVNTYLPSDYKSDPAFAQVIADTIELPLDIVQQTPSLEFDWEIRGGTVDRMQDAYHTTGAMEDTTAHMDESQLVDRSFYERAVGHTS